MNSITLYKNEYCFMNSEKSKISGSHRLLFKLSYKTYLNRSDKYVALSNLRIYYTWKSIKKVIQKQ